MIVLVYKL